MSIIKILSDHLVNQIAAGEVVERPASVVKELVENSIDAGASEIIVEIEAGGKVLIRVSDNGHGMSRDDAEKSLLRHATSKIGEESDLWNINTMGFRGEALASIASVSQMILKTKSSSASDVVGTEIVIDGGEVKTIQDCGMKNGTVIEVNNLFFNTPARSNYLKKDSTEQNHIIAWLNTVSFAHPEIAFKFISNGKVVMDLPGGVELQRRLADVFGKSTSDAMLPVFYGGSEFKLEGFIGKPVISRSDSKHQYIFVNKRPISHYLIAFKVKDAFRSLLMEGKKPVFVLNIEIDPSLIDVNVHPRKLEIRFEDESTILKKVYSAVNAALESNDLSPKAYTEASNYMSNKFPDKDELSGFTGGGATGDAAFVGSGFSGFDLNRGRIQGSLDLEENRRSLKAITQVSNSYIVAQNDDGLVLIDQHAAHERVRFFELLDQYESESARKNIQPLLVPQELELMMDEVGTLKDNMEVFVELGFEFEDAPDGELVLYAVPSVLSGEDVNDVMNGVLADISVEKAPSNLQGRKELILHYMSCRSAIKFGQKLSIDEMDGLLDSMEKIDRPYTCPHGRPTMIRLTFDELEKMFGRKG
jgi:DNA mismatch repair protein MutL